MEASWGDELKLPVALRGVVPEGCLYTPPNRGGRGGPPQAVYDLQLTRWGGRPFTPFDYQRDVIRGLIDRQRSGRVVGMLALPTGGGKTAVAAATVLQGLAQSMRGLVLWIAPQRELLQQALAAFERVWWSGLGPNSLGLEVVRPGVDCRMERDCSVVLSTPASAARWLAEGGRGSQITHLVFDEAHHLGANFFSSVWDAARFESTQLQLVLGLSATPRRLDGHRAEALEEALDRTLFYPKVLAPTPVQALRSRGVLAELQVVDLPGVPWYAFDAQGNAALDALVSDPDYWMACIEAARSELGRVLVYCPTRDAGQLFASHLNFLGEHAEFIDGEDPLDVRLAAFERFRDGHTRLLVNVGLLFEGVDCPSADAAVVTYSVGSVNRVLQIAGRVSRGPAVGGGRTARVVCVDPRMTKLLRSQAADPDYLAAWTNGVAL